MTTAWGGTIGSVAIMGLGSLLPAQSSLLASTGFLGGTRLPEKKRKSSAPVPIGINVAAADPGAAEARALVSGMAASPPRTVSFTGTRRVLAPSYCLSKTPRRRRPSNAGDGSEPDDDGGGGGSDDGGSNFGGGGGDFDGWDEDERRGAGSLADTLCLWQALCLFSLLQALHYVATGARRRDSARVSALAVLTHSLYNSRRGAVAIAL